MMQDNILTKSQFWNYVNIRIVNHFSLAHFDLNFLFFKMIGNFSSSLSCFWEKCASTDQHTSCARTAIENKKKKKTKKQKRAWSRLHSHKQHFGIIVAKQIFFPWLHKTLTLHPFWVTAFWILCSLKYVKPCASNFKK